MELNLKKEWFLLQAEREGVLEIGAGSLDVEAPELVCEAEVAYSADASTTPLPAFALLLRLKRRERRWTLEQLAQRADVELSELVSIDQKNLTPRPRTVVQLAQALEIPTTALTQLSGLTRPDPVLQKRALQFAARSESFHALSAEEKAALSSFVSFLRGEPE